MKIESTGDYQDRKQFDKYKNRKFYGFKKIGETIQTETISFDQALDRALYMRKMIDRNDVRRNTEN